MRVSLGVAALVAVFSMATALEEEARMILQLHRVPRHDHHTEQYMRRLNTEEGNLTQVVPLHLGLGTHYTWVYAGTPPQRASVITDTGSALMAFPCTGCDKCGNHTDLPFNTTSSSTLVHLTCAHESIFKCSTCTVQTDMCSFSQSYFEGSTWTANVVEDIVYLGADSSFDDLAMRNHYGTHFQFGCQHADSGLFVTQVADGIMGLSNSDTHIVAKLYHENKIANNLFSLCFTEQGGTMAIGQPFQAAHRGTIEYVKLLADRSPTHFYSVRMKDVRIGNVSIHAHEEAYTRGHYIIDSGTTDSYLPRTLKTEFLQVFQQVAGRAYQSGEKCKSYTNTDLASLPTIQLVMEANDKDAADVVITVPPEHYLFETNGAYCGSLYLEENSGGVIGANFMMGRDVVFDLGNQRVGFVDADCAYEGTKTTAPPSIHKSVGGEELEGETNESKETALNATTTEESKATTTEDSNATTTEESKVTTTEDLNATTTEESSNDESKVLAIEDSNATIHNDSKGLTVEDSNATIHDDSKVSTVEDSNATIHDDSKVSTVEDSNATIQEVNVSTVEVLNATSEDATAASIPAVSSAPEVTDVDAAPVLEPRGTVKPSVNPKVVIESSTTGSAFDAVEETTTGSALEALEDTTTETTDSVSDETQLTTESNENEAMQPLADESAFETLAASSSSSSGDHKATLKSSSAHPLVLTIVGAVLVVGFLLMMLISVSRRRQKDGSDQLWSRVKGDEADDDDDDEEEFGLVRSDKHVVTTKHQRLPQEDHDRDHSQSSSDDDDEIFDMHEEAKTEHHSVTRL